MTGRSVFLIGAILAHTAVCSGPMNTTTTTTDSKLIDVQFIIARCKLVLLDPKGCWSQIANETSSPVQLVKTIYLPLSVLGAVCLIVGLSLFGIAVPFVGTFRPGFSALIGQALSSVILSVAAPFIVSFIFEKLAPYFEGTAPFNKSFSLLVHTAIPSLIGQCFILIPGLRAVGLLVGSLYGLYLLYCGFNSMIQVPEGKRLPFIVTAIVVAIVVQMIIGSISGSLAPTPAGYLAP
jgi:hypothetical protein